MRIGRDDNFSSIEQGRLESGYAVCKVEAVAAASGRKFTASHDRLLLDASVETIKRFADFASLNREKFEVLLSEGGWFRFRRDLRGHITFSYRIAGWKASAAMEGEVPIDGEFANRFLRGFEAILRGQT